MHYNRSKIAKLIRNQSDAIIPLVKQYRNPACSISLALRASKQAGPRCAPGVCKISLSCLTADISASNETNSRLHNTNTLQASTPETASLVKQPCVLLCRV